MSVNPLSSSVINGQRISGPTPESAKLGPPPRWHRCPRKGLIAAGKFVPFKTPLCSFYDDFVPEQYRFSVDMVFSAVRNLNQKIGLWIDLTNTDRFYAKSEVESHGAKYMKFQCRGHGECPSQSQTNAFCVLCKDFITQHPNEIIGVHCTHGFNRTGFLICAYLVTEMGWSIDAAVNIFSQSRPPGIYKQDYLRDLFVRFGDVDDTPTAPALPDWCDESEPVLNDDEAEALSSSTKTVAGKVPQFSPPVSGVTAITVPAKARPLQQKCSSMCKWHKKGFPGSQPVSMDCDNLKFLAEKLYRVSWKADGVRYMMLIDGPGEVYMFDRDHNVFHIAGLRFPRARDLDKHIRNTLLEGEMVVDKVNGKDIPRYLIYDVVQFEKNEPSSPEVGKLDFYKRLSCVEHQIVGPRNEAIKQGKINRDKEPFSIRVKQFFDVTAAEKLLSEEFKKQLGHECDGLVFQNVPDPYMPGRSDYVLKWKPPHLNSVDFKLMVQYESDKEGCIPAYVGYLYVLGLDQPFAVMKPVTKELKALDKKIIECSWEKGRWKFMRERTDKSFPNSFQTASGVCKSIQSPVTTEILLNFIKQHAKKPAPSAGPPVQQQLRPPPQNPPNEVQNGHNESERSFKRPESLPESLQPPVVDKRIKTA